MSFAQPPERPVLPVDIDYQRGIRWSMGAHAFVILLILVKAVVFPNMPKVYVPTLRVDVVGLPDLLKTEKKNPPGKTLDDIQKMLQKAQADANKVKAPPPKVAAPVEKAAPDEMVLHPNPAQNDQTATKSAKDKKAEAAKQKSLEAALRRIKALAKIDSENTPVQATAGAPIKGNKISKGNSTAGDAKESDTANYYDTVRSKLQENWALPVWLSRQNLSATIEIVIDSRGTVREFRFVKSSGNPQYDDAVKSTLAKSQPFETPPNELLGNTISIGFPL
jgi:colicin import membrane protein